jgi:hypothetical protein
VNPLHAVDDLPADILLKSQGEPPYDALIVVVDGFHKEGQDVPSIVSGHYQVMIFR